MRSPLLAAALAATLSAATLSATPALAAVDAVKTDPYPTDAIAEYVYACMKANGETRDVLMACSCSFDVVASIVPYDRYVAASTFLSLMQMHGENAAPFRDSVQSKAAIKELRRAQAEGDVRCFNNSH